MTGAKARIYALPQEPQDITEVRGADGRVWTKTDELFSASGMAGTVEHKWAGPDGIRFSWGLLVRQEGPLTADEPPRVNDTDHDVLVLDRQFLRDQTAAVIPPGGTFPADALAIYDKPGSAL